MRAIYNRIYYRLTFSIFDLFKSNTPKPRRRRTVAHTGSSTHQGAFDGCLEFLILLLIAAAIIFFL